MSGTVISLEDFRKSGKIMAPPQESDPPLSALSSAEKLEALRHFFGSCLSGPSITIGAEPPFERITQDPNPIKDALEYVLDASWGAQEKSEDFPFLATSLLGRFVTDNPVRGFHRFMGSTSPSRLIGDYLPSGTPGKGFLWTSRSNSRTDDALGISSPYAVLEYGGDKRVQTINLELGSARSLFVRTIDYSSIGRTGASSSIAHLGSLAMSLRAEHIHFYSPEGITAGMARQYLSSRSPPASYFK